MIKLEVDLIHRSRGVALLSDGQEVPITSWMDGAGECDPIDATACVCGPDFDGKWYAVDLTQFGGRLQ